MTDGPTRLNHVEAVGRALRFAGLALVISLGLSRELAAQSLPLDHGWLTPAGFATPKDGAIELRGEPGIEQAVLLFAPVDIDADASTYVRVDHDGLAPQHQLSLYFRADDGEHTIDLPTTRGSVTAHLPADQGWRGHVSEIALVYGPAGNIPTLVADDTMRIEKIEFVPESAGARFAAFLSRELQVFDVRGTSNNVQPKTTLSAIFGVAAAVALLVGVLGGPRLRTIGRIAFVAVFALSLALAFRQWSIVRASTERIADDRRAKGRELALDFELVDIATRLRNALSGHENDVSFVLKVDDPYVGERLRFLLLPFRARYREPDEWLASDRCVFAIDDDVASASPYRAETSFGPIVLTVASRNPEACRSYSLPRLR